MYYCTCENPPARFLDCFNPKSQGQAMIHPGLDTTTTANLLRMVQHKYWNPRIEESDDSKWPTTMVLGLIVLDHYDLRVTLLLLGPLLHVRLFVRNT